MDEKKVTKSTDGTTKTLIIVLVIMCLALAIGVTVYQVKNGKSITNTGTETAATVVEETEASSEEEEETVKTLDYDELYKAFNPDEIVMTVAGEDVSWGEYYGWLKQYAQSADYYITMYKYYYGYDTDWEDFAPEVVEYSKQQLAYMKAIKLYSAENDIVPEASEIQGIWDKLDEDVAAQYGEATEENKKEYLAEIDMTENEYYENQYTNLLYNLIKEKNFGENGELVSDEDAMAYLEDNGYMYAGHILLCTIDLSTGEELSEDEIKTKTDLANELSNELRAIEDKDELLKRFAELKEQYCEDSGKASYPNGYVFQSGKMVEEFENGVLALGDYEVSEPVKSQYGYHIIIRLPLDADAVMEYSSVDNSAVTGRLKYADEMFANMINEEVAKVEIIEKDGFKGFDLMKFVHET